MITKVVSIYLYYFGNFEDTQIQPNGQKENE
jgi:hypothetical protein